MKERERWKEANNTYSIEIMSESSERGVEGSDFS